MDLFDKKVQRECKLLVMIVRFQLQNRGLSHNQWHQKKTSRYLFIKFRVQRNVQLGLVPRWKSHTYVKNLFAKSNWEKFDEGCRAKHLPTLSQIADAAHAAHLKRVEEKDKDPESPKEGVKFLKHRREKNQLWKKFVPHFIKDVW